MFNGFYHPPLPKKQNKQNVLNKQIQMEVEMGRHTYSAIIYYRTVWPKLMNAHVEVNQQVSYKANSDHISHKK